MMIHHVWTVVCSNSVIDYETNNVSLHNVLEQLTISGEPLPTGIVPIPLEVVTLWTLADLDAPSRGRMQLTLISPSGHILGNPYENEIDLSTHHRRRVRVRFQGLPVPEPGRYTFLVEFQNEGDTEWQQVAAIPLEVVFEVAPTE